MAAKNKPGRKKRGAKLAYNSTRRWLSNKVRRLRRVVKEQPTNECAIIALKKAESKL